MVARVTNYNQSKQYSLLIKFSIFVWILMIVLTGTYLRTRPVQEAQVDWLVAIRGLTFGVGLILGFILIRKSRKWGPANKVIFAYIVATGLSIFATVGHKVVFGYWILLAGAALLTMGLVSAKGYTDILTRMEKLWLITVIAILLKDSIISILSITKGGAIEKIEPERLGEAVLSPAFMGLYAAMAFWITFKGRKGSGGIIIWMVRAFLLYVIAVARTRIAIISFLFSGMVYMGFSGRRNTGRFILIICLCILSFSVWSSGDVLNIESVNRLSDWFNRGQSEEVVKTITGRTEVWESAIRIVSKDFKTIIFGFGYGATRFYLNWKQDSPRFFANHCHNAYIEHLFSTGLVGVSIFVILVIVSVRWLTRFYKIEKNYPIGFARHAAVTVVVMLVAFLTEIPMGGRMNPIAILYIFYVAALDNVSSGRVREKVKSNAE